ncbi:cupin domain-containing protein [Saccharopolyspora phatthalungensis]|uniref:Mannose-6-phosphate isomerase-like protein (Cupin superfamily) n=1 Tax=Saccharopolyspora phatthalungensis TaxID=664693 RepID=A0A840QE62_9PSEU|nr:cupin domain-containing protein [Saccharopolyspora phatthalungensis]MBB5156958.1 mannose-6-phosphate isomerase-like protein (cupin superfamily) [Saccharopolyspora phatthalungensis]
MSTANHRVIRSGDGTDVGAIGLGIFTRLTGADTGGAYSVFEYIVPPGLGGPPTHIHSREDELFTCVRGRVAVELDGEKHELGEGDCLLMPRGVPHVFYNPFEEETRIVAVVSPPGLENYYRELSELPPGRDMTLVSEVMTRYGLTLQK